MAPEQFRGEPTDARSDQFSYCVALHEALYGFRPRLAHLDNDGGPGDVPSAAPAEGRRRVPAWLRSAVLRGLRHDPPQRFASINELLAILDRGRARVRRRMIGAAASLAVVLAVAAGWRVSHPQRYECRPAPSRLADAWSAEGGAGSRRDRLNQALLASGREDAAAVWRRLSAALDGHVARWTAMYQETCEATHVRGEQSAEVLDLRMRCLANNLDEVRALTDVLSGANAVAVGQAVSAAGRLTPVAVCADVPALRATVPFPKDEQSRRTVEGLQRRLNDVRALREVGHSHDAMDKARALRSLIEQAGYPPLTASLLMITGMMQIDSGDFVESLVTLKASFVAAELGNDSPARADAAINLVFPLSQLGRRDECDLWLREANAILDRLGPGHERARAWALNNEAAVLADAGDLERARQTYERAIALKEQSAGPTHPDVAMSLIGLGDVLKDLGNLEAALAAEDRALAIWNEDGGSFAAKAENNKAEILLALARPAEAVVTFERALRALEREGGPDNINLAYPLRGLGEAKLVQGDADAAVGWFERALRLRQDDKEQNSPLLVAETQFGLARALWDAKQSSPAGSVARPFGARGLRRRPSWRRPRQGERLARRPDAPKVLALRSIFVGTRAGLVDSRHSRSRNRGQRRWHVGGKKQSRPMQRLMAALAIAASALGGCTTTHQVRRPDTVKQIEPLHMNARYPMTLLHERPPGATSTVPSSLVLDPNATANHDAAPLVDLSNLRGYTIKRRGQGALEGLGLGMLVGVVTGAATGIAAGDDPMCPMYSESNCILRFSAADKAVGFGIAGALIGGLLGTLIGTAIGHTDEYIFRNPHAQP